MRALLFAADAEHLFLRLGTVVATAIVVIVRRLVHFVLLHLVVLGRVQMLLAGTVF